MQERGGRDHASPEAWRAFFVYKLRTTPFSLAASGTRWMGRWRQNHRFRRRWDRSVLSLCNAETIESINKESQDRYTEIQRLHPNCNYQSHTVFLSRHVQMTIYP
jgi:hypothetical protein